MKRSVLRDLLSAAEERPERADRRGLDGSQTEDRGPLGLRARSGNGGT